MRQRSVVLLDIFGRKLENFRHCVSLSGTKKTHAERENFWTLFVSWNFTSWPSRDFSIEQRLNWYFTCAEEELPYSSCIELCDILTWMGKSFAVILVLWKIAVQFSFQRGGECRGWFPSPIMPIWGSNMRRDGTFQLLGLEIFSRLRMNILDICMPVFSFITLSCSHLSL